MLRRYSDYRPNPHIIIDLRIGPETGEFGGRHLLNKRIRNHVEFVGRGHTDRLPAKNIGFSVNILEGFDHRREIFDRLKVIRMLPPVQFLRATCDLASVVRRIDSPPAGVANCRGFLGHDRKQRAAPSVSDSLSGNGVAVDRTTAAQSHCREKIAHRDEPLFLRCRSSALRFRRQVLTLTSPLQAESHCT